MALRRILRDELRVLDALLYTHRNAHGRTQYYQRLTTIRGSVRVLCEHHPSSQPRPTDGPIEDGERFVSDLCKRAGHLHASVGLCDRLGVDIARACRYLLMLIGQSYFMPFALTMMAVCGRIRTLTKQMRATFCGTFRKEYARLAALREDTKLPSWAIDTLASLTPLDHADPFDVAVASVTTPSNVSARAQKRPLPASSSSSSSSSYSSQLPSDAGEVLARPSQMRKVYSKDVAGRMNDVLHGERSTKTEEDVQSTKKKKKKKEKKKKKKKKRETSPVLTNDSFFRGGGGLANIDGHDEIDDIFG